MTHDHDVKVQNQAWSPRMLQLTAISSREVDYGTPQKVYVDPYCIALAVRSVGSWSVQDGGEPNPRIECTTVWLRGGGPQNILVVESPEEVALRRDRALEIPVQFMEVD